MSTLSCCDIRYNGRRRQSMSLEMVPEPKTDDQRSSPLAQRRVKSYEEAVGEPDYDRNRITQFIRQPFSTKPTVEELRRSTSAAAADASVSGRSRPTFSYNDTGSFEEVDEEKVGTRSLRTHQCSPATTDRTVVIAYVNFDKTRRFNVSLPVIKI